jgi:hypothetical protein
VPDGACVSRLQSGFQWPGNAGPFLWSPPAPSTLVLPAPVSRQWEAGSGKWQAASSKQQAVKLAKNQGQKQGSAKDSKLLSASSPQGTTTMLKTPRGLRLLDGKGC